MAVEEDRPRQALADGEVNRSSGAWGERDGDRLAALSVHDERAVPPLEPEVLDVGTERLGDARPLSASSDAKAWSWAQ